MKTFRISYGSIHHWNRPIEVHRINSDMDKPKSIKIPVIEEQVKVDKKLVEKDRVRIIKRIKEENVPVTYTESNEKVEVKRVPINQYVETPPAVRHEGNTMVIPVVREEVVVTKRFLLVEELRVTKHRDEIQITQEVRVRAEEITVQRDSETGLNAET